MEISRVIIGPVVTEKAEALKNAKVYTVTVAPEATKVDVKNAFKKFYDVDVRSVRIIWTRAKVRSFGQNKTMEKRHRAKKAIVTLTDKAKNVDLTSFKNR